MKYKVVEKFVSINGEGRLSGQLAVFIRFKGCNLDCSYCDTRWANEENVNYKLMSKEEIYEYIKKTKVRNITLTGGEPLLQENIIDLLEYLVQDKELTIEIETNGSILLKDFKKIKKSIRFTMDYKLVSSNMESKMLVENFNFLDNNDTLKFVIGNKKDLIRAKEIIDKYKLIEKTNIYLSPVFSKINYEDIVDFMKENLMNKVTFQIQLHKIIWDPEKKGV